MLRFNSILATHNQNREFFINAQICQNVAQCGTPIAHTTLASPQGVRVTVPYDSSGLQCRAMNRQRANYSADEVFRIELFRSGVGGPDKTGKVKIRTSPEPFIGPKFRPEYVRQLRLTYTGTGLEYDLTIVLYDQLPDGSTIHGFETAPQDFTFSTHVQSSDDVLITRLRTDSNIRTVTKGINFANYQNNLLFLVDDDFIPGNANFDSRVELSIQ